MRNTPSSRAEKRRLQLVAHISTNIATAPETPERPKAAAEAEPVAATAQAAETAGEGAASPEIAAAAEPAEAADVGAALAEAPEEAAVAEEPSVEPAEAESTEPPAAEAEPPPIRKGRGGAVADAAEADATPDQSEAEALPSEPQLEVAAAATSPAPALTALGLQGGKSVWDQLTPTDIDRAKRELGVRRAEMLARHAEELKALEVEQGQIDVLEQAIASFLQKFNAPGGDAAVVKLDQERELRQQGNS